MQPPILDVRGLKKRFGALEVLKGIDFAVAAQELVFVIGPSGSGKSTLLRCCNRLEEPDGGSIRVDGVDLMDKKCDINAMRRRIGMVFQSFNLYPHMTALGNVTLALRKVIGRSRREADEIGRAALEQVGLADKAARLSGRALGRPAAAGRDRPRAFARAEDHALRRADLGARSGARRLGACRHARHAPRRHDHGRRLARDALRARGGGPRHVHGGRTIVEEGPPERIFSAPENARTRAFVAEIAR